MKPRRHLVAALAAAALPGCIASNVVAPAERMVVQDLGELAFAPAPGLQLAGLYESLDIRGDAALSLRKVYYLFAPDGSYTAAALTESGGTFAFQTLSGSWRSTPAGLVLDEAEPVPLEQCGEHLRLSAPTGSLILIRRDVL